MGKLESSFSGYIDEIPFIHVDNFENKHKSAYFLSHYHGDHLIGLKDVDFPAKLKKNNAFIYASEVTIAIMKNHYPALAPFLRVLELGRNTVTIKENDKDIYLPVITLPAGHCLGSTMFLFQHNQTVLYSGDIRINPNTLSKFTHLHKDGEPIKIDVLYVDTTFQMVPSFPKRSDVMRNVVTHVTSWLKADTMNSVLLETSARYGYECICNEIYNATGIKTYINEEKWNIFSQFPKELYGVTNNSTSRIKMYSKYEANILRHRLTHMDNYRIANMGNNRMANMQQNKITDTNSASNILSIYFSALKWRNNVNNEENFIEIINKNKINVCFSLHCDRQELLYFVNYLRPNKVVGFPDDFVGTTVPVPPVPVPPVPEIPDPKTKDVLEISLLTRKRSKSNENCSDNKKICNESMQSMFGWK